MYVIMLTVQPNVFYTIMEQFKACILDQLFWLSTVIERD